MQNRKKKTQIYRTVFWLTAFKKVYKEAKMKFTMTGVTL